MQILRKELDVLKSSVLKAEATAAEAGKRYDDENRKVKELQAQFRAANEVRQEAYARWQNLRKELSKKVMGISQLHLFNYISMRNCITLHIVNATQRLVMEAYIRLDIEMLESNVHPRTIIFWVEP